MRQRLFDDKYVGYHTFGLGLNYVNYNQGSNDIHIDDPIEDEPVIIDDGGNGGGKDPGRGV